MPTTVTILLGVYITLIGFRVISASKKQDEKYEEWLKKWGLFLKIGGPVLILAGILQIVMRVMK